MNTDMDIAAGNARLVVRAEVRSMHLLYDFIESLCDRYDYPDTFRMETQLVLEEVLVNIINYAYPNDNDPHDVVVQFMQPHADEACFVFEDDGVAFDPTAYKRVNVDAPIENRAVGGLGIHLMRQLSNGMSYRREGNRNILTIIKTVSDEPSGNVDSSSHKSE